VYLIATGIPTQVASNPGIVAVLVAVLYPGIVAACRHPCMLEN